MSKIIFQDTAWPNIIELKHVCQSYTNRDPVTKKMVTTEVLKDVNFLIEDKPNVGQFVVMLGESGCGKSTLLRYVVGIQEPTSGQILLHEKIRTRHDTVGMVFQQYSCFPWYTVLENVMLPLKLRNVAKSEAHDRAMEMIKLVGLEGHENKWAKMPNVSGGQLQRIAIARSLICNPEIIMMDEPFGALDTRTRYKMQQLLADIWMKIPNMTIVFVTHDIPEAVFLADDIYIMRKGGSFEGYYHVDLPNYRERSVKKSPYYKELCEKIDDDMYAMID